jgi:hypothetical protein
MYETFERQSMDVRNFAKANQWNGLERGVRDFAEVAPWLAINADAIIPPMRQLAQISKDSGSREYIIGTIGKFESLMMDLNRKAYDRKPFINKARESVCQILQALYPLELLAPFRRETTPSSYVYKDNAINYQPMMNPADENMLRIRG